MPEPSSLQRHPLDIAGLVSFWDFQSTARGGFRAQGPGDYLLRWRTGPPQQDPEGVFGPGVLFKPGLWLECPRMQCPLLNFSAKRSSLTLVAWVKWRANTRCQFIAGMWDETNAARQYGLFFNLSGRYASERNVHAHVSADGAPTQGDLCCLTYATGGQALNLDQWYTIAMVFDGETARVYVNGILDTNTRTDDRWGQLNPFGYRRALFDGGKNGADFTVGSVDSGGKMNNWFFGTMGGLAVYDRALDEADLRALHRLPRAGASEEGGVKVLPSTQ